MSKTYKCPYCDKYRGEREKLIVHINGKHEDVIPEGYTAGRVVYDLVNKKPSGYDARCRICGNPAGWNEKAGRYNQLCGNPKCKETYREQFKQNMIRVRGTYIYNNLNDPEQQQKMLAARSISGKYTFQDGGVLGYTGSYEKKCLEFMDVVMNIPSKDILSPGPIIKYTYEGKEHFYIPDFLYIPYNLIIEVKDEKPESSPYSKRINSSREKTIEKERIITEKGIYNYLRLTGNDFSQLLDVFMELKKNATDGVPDIRVVKMN